MSDFVTIELISDKFRHDFPELGSETFAIVLHQGTSAHVVATDEDATHLAPSHWARDIAVRSGVPFMEPAESVGFAFDQATQRWYAYDCGDDGRKVANRYAGRLAAVFVGNGRAAA